MGKNRKVHKCNRIRKIAFVLTGAGCLAVSIARSVTGVQAANIENTKMTTEVTVGVTERSSDVSVEVPLYVTIGVVRSDEDPARQNKVVVPEGYGIENQSYETLDVIVTDILVEPFTEKDPDQPGKYKLSEWQIVNTIDDTKNERQVALKIGGVQIPTLDRGTEDKPAARKSIWESSVVNAPASQFFNKDKMGIDRYPVIGVDAIKNPDSVKPGTTMYKIEADVPANFLPSANGEGGDNYTAGIMKIQYSFATLVDDGTGTGNKVIQNAGRYNKQEEYTGPVPATGQKP